MSAIISFKKDMERQYFWVSNGLKDVFFEAVIEMTCVTDPKVAMQMETGHLSGIYGVSGLGFNLEDFVAYLGSEERFIAITQAGVALIESVCGNPICTKNLTKLFHWVWFLLRGGTLPLIEDRILYLDDLPDEPKPGPL